MANNMYNNKYEFEWDDNKNIENIRKHDISFHEAQEAFYDAKGLVYADEKHSNGEKRYVCVGCAGKRIITVRFTLRGTRIRIFGAGYWRKGRKQYGRLDRSGS